MKGKEQCLEQALEHLERADGGLEVAKSAPQAAEAEEKAAEAAEDAAEKEIHGALQEIKEAKERHHEIHIFVDGERYETEKREMTPSDLITEFGLKDPATNYLVQIREGQQESYQGKGNEFIELHNGMRFMIVFMGPTTVSDGPMQTGVGVFLEGLRGLGYRPTALPGKPDHLVMEYVVETGRFTGRQVRLGLVVPPDFPVTPPTGPHVSPHIHPISPGGAHPTGGVHDTHSLAFEAGAGGHWQYWSRPYPQWGQSGRRSAAEYMSHVWRLWDTQ